MLGRSRLAGLMLAVALGGNACSSPSQPVVPEIVPAEAVKVTPQSVQLSAIGATRQLLATVTPANATDRAVTWESSDPAIVTVDATGLITAKSVGAGVFVTVFTHDGHHQASVNVTVTP